MAVAGCAEPPALQATFRSWLRPEQPVRSSGRNDRRHRNPWSPALRLVGHMASTTFVFTSLVTLAWLVSLGFSILHSIHPFSGIVYQLLEWLKIVLICLDAAMSGVVLLHGLWRYVCNVIRGDS
jgi:hypothetical protein